MTLFYGGIKRRSRIPRKNVQANWPQFDVRYFSIPSHLSITIPKERLKVSREAESNKNKTTRTFQQQNATNMHQIVFMVYNTASGDNVNLRATV